jgi:DNA-binding GntR family transcriptional regulator
LAHSSHRIAAEALKRGDAASARAAIRADIDRARSMS